MSSRRFFAFHFQFQERAAGTRQFLNRSLDASHCAAYFALLILPKVHVRRNNPEFASIIQRRTRPLLLEQQRF